MNWDTCEEPSFFKSLYAFVRRVGMRSLDFFRPRGALVRSHTFFKACMCGEVGILRRGFLWLGDFLSNSKKLVDLQNMNRITCEEPYLSKLLRSSDTVQWVP